VTNPAGHLTSALAGDTVVATALAREAAVRRDPGLPLFLGWVMQLPEMQALDTTAMLREAVRLPATRE